jgi:hypothetical protein
MLLLSVPVLAQQDIGNIINKQEKHVLKSKSSQNRINSLDRQTQQMLEEYKLTLYKIDNLKAYNQHLENLVNSQKSELQNMRQQLGEIDNTQQNISPLMLRMVDNLDQFVKLDIPFHKKERAHRIADLKSMMSRSDVSVAEKYRRIMEAYKIETGYGKTLAAYQGGLEFNNEKLTVEYLRVGRIGFFYRTLDGEKRGYWDKASQSWRSLPDEYDNYIDKALKVAKKHTSPDLLMVPVQYSEVNP